MVTFLLEPRYQPIGNLTEIKMAFPTVGLCECIQEHRGAITQKKMDHPVGAHFNQVGLRHSVTDLIPLAIERVVPKHDTALRKRREHFWINNYRATSLGANRRD